MTSRPSPTNSSRGTNLDAFALEREGKKLPMNGMSATSQKNHKLPINAVTGMKRQHQFNPQSMLSNVLERDIDDISWMNHIVFGTGKTSCASDETKNYANDDSVKTSETANSSQGTHVDVCALKSELNRIVLGAGNITLALEKTNNFFHDDSKKTIQSEILSILSTVAKINILLMETDEDNDRNDLKAEEPPLSGKRAEEPPLSRKRAEEPPLSNHAKSGSFLCNSDAIFALGKHDTTRILFETGTIDDDVFRRCCEGHRILVEFKSNLAKVFELYPEMFRKMCGFEYLDAFIEAVEKKGDFIDIEKKINLTMKQKRLKLQHLVKAAKGMKQDNLELLGEYLHDCESDLSSISE
jgi:hypothetical protein